MTELSAFPVELAVLFIRLPDFLQIFHCLHGGHMAKPQAWGIMVGGGLLGTVRMIVTVKCLFVRACLHACVWYNKFKGFNEACEGSATEGGLSTCPVVPCK